MKKIILVSILAMVAFQLKAQGLLNPNPLNAPVNPNTNNYLQPIMPLSQLKGGPDLFAASNIDKTNTQPTNNLSYNMPIVVPTGNSRMPVLKIEGNSKMPVINPDVAAQKVLWDIPALNSPAGIIVPAEKNR